MVKFVQVDPNDIPNFRDSHRGRVSYPILKSFLETNMALAQLDRTGMQQSLQSLNSSLGAYIRSHALPIKLFMRRGEVYLARTDINPETGLPEVFNEIGGRVHEAVGIAPIDLLEDNSIPEINAGVVTERFGIEKNMTTK